MCIYICKSLQLHLFVSGSFLYFLGVGWNQCPLQLLSHLTDAEQNCQHVIFFNLPPLRSNEISQHPSAITVVHFCLALIVPPPRPFPWCPFSCISPDCSHQRFSLSHAAHQAGFVDFVLKGNLKQKVSKRSD